MGGQATWSSLTSGGIFNPLFLFVESGASEHAGLLQHEVLPVEDGGHALEALLLAHHEALEEADAGAGGRQQEQADPAEVLPAQRQATFGQRR